MNNSCPKVSVIIQAYNEEACLARSIDSVLNQTYQNFELILIDNGSGDGTGSIMDSYCHKDTRIQVIHLKANQSYVYWIDHLLEFVHGAFFVSLDADDWLEQEFLEKCMDVAQADGADIVCTLHTFVHIDGSTEATAQFREQLRVERNQFPQHFRLLTCLESAWAKLFRTTLLSSIDFAYVKKVTASKAGFGWDTALWWSCIMQAKSISLCPEPLYNYLIDDISMQKYHQRLPYIYRCFPITLTQEYELLATFGAISKENLNIMATEYLSKMADCLEVDLDDATPIIKR